MRRIRDGRPRAHRTRHRRPGHSNARRPDRTPSDLPQRPRQYMSKNSPSMPRNSAFTGPSGAPASAGTTLRPNRSTPPSRSNAPIGTSTRLGNTHGKTSPDTPIPAGFTPPGYRTPREAYNDYTTSDRQHELTIIIRPENAGPPKARIGPPAPGTSSTADDQASIKPRRTRKTTGVIITPGDTSAPMP
jgi:hypothetical protein